jgi:hypothetical protein
VPVDLQVTLCKRQCPARRRQWGSISREHLRGVDDGAWRCPGRHGWGYGDFVPKQHLRTNRWEIVDAYRVPNGQQIKEVATLILLGPLVASRIIIIIE